MPEHIKDRLPDIEAVENQLKSVLKSTLPDFLSVTNSRRQEVIGNRRYAVVSFFFAITIMIALFFMSDSYGTWPTNFLVGCAMFWLVVVLVTGRRWIANDKLLAKEMSMALVPILTSVFDRVLMYTHDSAHQEETRSLLTESELITVDDTTVMSDDMYTVYGEQEISFRELLVTQKIKNSKSSSSSQVQVFKGIFMVAKLNQSHDAETYISTEGDRSGFAHRTFWSDLFENSDVKETVFEWNDFEKDLHVASSDGAKAREILTPEFMQDLHDWWLSNKLNVRISFKGNKMYLLLPEASIQLGVSTTSTKLESIERYAWSLVRPIWRSLMLVDDVSR